ncbi:MAG: hypothetical protein ACLGSD_14795 [Acidobacteriota bacterium]
MNRTRKHKSKPKPKPGGAKLNLAVDKDLEDNAGKVSKALIGQAIAGNPTALHLLIRWAEDAEFAEECMTAHSSEIERWLAELQKEAEEAEAQKKKAEAQQKASSTAQ